MKLCNGKSRLMSRRGFATALVLWAVALAVLILSAVQMSAWRQASRKLNFAAPA